MDVVLVGRVTDTSPDTDAHGLFCITCKGIFALLQIGVTESEPLP